MKKNQKKSLEEILEASRKRDLKIARELSGVPVSEHRKLLLNEFLKEPVIRAFSGSASNFDDETQSFDFAFSSEYRVERWGAVEILSHEPGAVDLSRLNDGGAFCIDHNTWSGHVGVHEKAWLDEGEKKCRGRARLSKNNPRAVQEYLDIKDGIRCHISVTYWIHDVIVIEHDNTPNEYHVTRWTPLENSTVAVPADPSVGVGRSLGVGELPVDEPEKEQRSMGNKAVETAVGKSGNDTPDVTVVRAEARSAGQKEGLKQGQDQAARIVAAGRKFGQVEYAEECIREGRSATDAIDEMLERHSVAAPAPAEEIGLTNEETSGFRMTKLIRALDENTNMRAQEDAAFELEACAAVTSRDHGHPIPLEVMRAQQVSVDTDGGYLSPTTQVPSMIEELLNHVMVLKLGAQSFGNLVGNVDIPKETGGIEAFVVGEDESPAQSKAGFGLLTLAPKTVASNAYITRSMLKQTSFGMEMYVRRKIAQKIALKFDSLVIGGIGGRTQPIGLLNWPGVKIVNSGDNGDAPNRDRMVDLQTSVATGNALMENLAYLTSVLVRGKLLKTPEHPTANVGAWIWGKYGGPDPSVGEVVGYPAYATNQMPDDLSKGTSLGNCSAVAFGNWNDLILATWGTIEVLVDPYSHSKKGAVEVTSFFDFDSAVENADSFALIKDARAA